MAEDLTAFPLHLLFCLVRSQLAPDRLLPVPRGFQDVAQLMDGFTRGSVALAPDLQEDELFFLEIRLIILRLVLIIFEIHSLLGVLQMEVALVFRLTIDAHAEAMQISQAPRRLEEVLRVILAVLVTIIDYTTEMLYAVLILPERLG